MRIPFLHKRDRPIQRTVLGFIIQVVVPGLLVVYLLRTESSYLASFTREVEILLPGEVIYLSVHLIFTYILLPVIWFFDVLEFFVRDSDVLSILSAWYRFCASALFWLLAVAVALRILATW